VFLAISEDAFKGPNPVRNEVMWFEKIKILASVSLHMASAELVVK
jgi:hypothetical protein